MLGASAYALLRVDSIYLLGIVITCKLRKWGHVFLPTSQCLFELTESYCCFLLELLLQFHLPLIENRCLGSKGAWGVIQRRSHHLVTWCRFFIRWYHKLVAAGCPKILLKCFDLLMIFTSLLNRLLNLLKTTFLIRLTLLNLRAKLWLKLVFEHIQKCPRGLRILLQMAY